ncbi:MAG: hypothetical protein E4H19_09425 [Chromatiales bacterium]|nr:MAG: hypothetical protein E4H19_09425 [Chromatiales bacterium]
MVSPEEAKVVLSRSGSFVKAFHRKTPEIEGVPDSIIEKIVAEGVSASPLAEIEREIERFREFERAGLNEIALCLYDDPEASIRVIGERVVPALHN